jgi:hypothetical protein
VLIDNLDVSNLVRSVNISMEKDEPTEVELNMILGVLLYDVQSKVQIDAVTRELLLKLGWKEPDGRI